MHTGAHMKHVSNSNKSHVKNRLSYTWLTSHSNEVCMVSKRKNQFSPPDVQDIYIWNIEMKFDYHLCDASHTGSLTAVILIADRLLFHFGKLEQEWRGHAAWKRQMESVCDDFGKWMNEWMSEWSGSRGVHKRKRVRADAECILKISLVKFENHQCVFMNEECEKIKCIE